MVKSGGWSRSIRPIVHSIQLLGGAMDTKPKDRPTDVELEKAVFEAP